jgi:hypothetical protein
MNNMDIGQSLVETGDRRGSKFQKKGIKSSGFKRYKKSPKMNFPTQSVLQQNFTSVDGNKNSGPIPVKTNNPKKEPLKMLGLRRRASPKRLSTLTTEQ